MTNVESMGLGDLADEIDRIDKLLKTNPLPPVAPPAGPEREQASRDYPKVFRRWVEQMVAERYAWARKHNLIATDTPSELLDERYGMSGTMNLLNGWGNPFPLAAVKRGKRTSVEPETAEREATSTAWVDCFRKLDATNSARPHAIVGHAERLDDFEALATEYGLTVEPLRSWYSPNKCRALVASRAGVVGGEPRVIARTDTARGRA